MAATWSIDLAAGLAADAGLGELPVGGDGGQPFVDVDDGHRRDQRGERVAVGAGGRHCRPVRAAQGLGQTHDHFHHLVFLDQRGERCQIGSAGRVPRQSGHRSGQHAVRVAHRNSHANRTDVHPQTHAFPACVTGHVGGFIGFHATA